MDIEFSVHDVFSLTRPQWKLAANLEEAAKAFQLAVAQDQKASGADKAAEAYEPSSGPSSDEENLDVDELDAEGEEDDSASEDEEADDAEISSDKQSDFGDEDLVVQRQEPAVDPEDEAEFEREYAKMMAESIESRKFERKQLFDVPLPVRAKPRETSSSAAEASDENTPAPAPPGNKMAFALLTKKGNRQQVRDLATKKFGASFTDMILQTKTIELPSDSTFAVAMKNQQQAQKEEQQRIKNLVLNYDLQQNDEQDGNTYSTPIRTSCIDHPYPGQETRDRPSTFHHNRIERPKDRGQRSRKLQLSDMDW